MRKFNRGVVTFLRPEYRHTPPNDHMGNQIVMADKNFLGLDKVSGIKVDINASGCKSGTRHVFGSSVDDTIVKGEEIILAV